MRILTFLHSFGPGGVERDTLRMTDGWASASLDVHVVMGRAGGVMASEASDAVRFHVLEREGARSAEIESLWMIARLPALVRRLRPDVVYCPGNAYTIVAVALRLMLGRRCPPIVLRVSNDLRRADMAALPRWFYKRWLRLQAPAFAAIVAMAAPIRAEIADEMRVADSRIHVINNASIRRAEAAALAQARDAAMRDHQGRRFLAVGRLAPQKNFALLLAAFARIARAGDHLDIIGEGRERAMLADRAMALGIAGQVSMPGHRTPLDDAFARADAFVLSSDYEGLGVVVIEALAAGVPIVATDCCTAMPMLLDRAGLLVPAGDADALAAAMDRIATTPVDVAAMRARAAAFAVEDVTSAWVALFGAVGRGRPGTT